MSWEQLEAIGKTNAAEARRGDDYTGGSRPTNCPICFERLNYTGNIGDCPLGHYRTTEA